MNSERRKITNVSGDRLTLTLDKPLSHRHYSAIESYSYTNKAGATVNESIDMRVEVGLLSRNIVI